MDILVQEISFDTTKTLLHYKRFSGILPDTLKSIETSIGRPLDEELRSMYEYSNGFQLIWTYNDNPEYNSNKRSSLKSLSWDSMHNDYHSFDGVIFILPAENTFLGDWENIVWFKEEENYTTTFKGKTMSVLSFKRKLKPLDMFSKYYSVAIYLNEVLSESQIILGQDHEADFYSSKILSIKEYFNLLLITKGSIKERVNALKDSWGSIN